MVRAHFSERYQNAGEALQALLFLSQPPGTPAPTPTPAPTLQRFDFEVVTVDVRGNISSPQRRQAKFMSEDLGSGAILEMIAIPGGRFAMGSPTTEAQREHNESPLHPVNISPFFMGKYPVTQEQWQVVMENNPSNFQGAKLPVEQVSWNDAVKFCQKLSQKTGKNYRLPSEAEWEYTCRARTTTPFHFGETITPDLVNYSGCPYGFGQWGLYRGQTTDVRSFPPNAFGLYDMHGNVWEWCSDSWNNNYRDAPTDGSSWETGNEFRVRRGGSWNCNAALCRSAYRSGYGAGNHDSKIGFRVALVSV
jgi:formylglycine-generating enzyme required for sulfatase activity